MALHLMNRKTSLYAIAAIVMIGGLLMLPVAGANQATAKTPSPTYDKKITDYIKEILEQTGTVTKTETKNGHELVTTNTLTKTDKSEYALTTTTTMDGEQIHDEEFTIVVNDDSTYRLINEERGIDETFITTSQTTTRGSANESWLSASVRLYDRAYAEDGEVIGLSDSYNDCVHARFDAGVDTAGDTLVEWDAADIFWSYCFAPLWFDYVKITHEGNTRTSTSNDSTMSMSNSNGEGWYTATVKVYYD